MIARMMPVAALLIFSSILCSDASAMYASRTGTFCSRDPIRYFDSVSLYGYVANQPVTMNDPFGLQKGGGVRTRPVPYSPHRPHNPSPVRPGNRPERTPNGPGPGGPEIYPTETRPFNPWFPYEREIEDWDYPHVPSINDPKSPPFPWPSNTPKDPGDYPIHKIVCKDKKCPPCPLPPPLPKDKLPRVDRVPPSKKHFPCPGDHLHTYWYETNQDPVTCACFHNLQEDVQCL